MVTPSDEWTDEERAQWAEVSAEYVAAESAVRAAEAYMGYAVQKAHRAGDRMVLRLLRERNEARAKLAAVEGTDLPVDPPGTFYFTLRLSKGPEALVREHAQRPSLVVDIPMCEMTASEGRAIAQAILRVCRSLEAQPPEQEEGVEP